jgi:hypothetical protein
MLNLLSKFLASLLVLVSLSIIASFILGQTLLSSEYMQQQLKDAKAYSRLSEALSKQVADSVAADNPQIEATIQQVITPDTLQQRVDPALSQLEEYYKGNAPPPQIEVNDLLAQIQAAGVPIETNSDLATPIQLAPESKTKPVTAKFGAIGIIAVILALVLIAALAFLSWKAKRYTILANVAISIGIATGLIAIFLLFAPGVFDHFVQFDANSNIYAGILHDLARSIAQDIGRRYALFAAVFLVLGIAARIVISRAARPATPQVAK